MSNYDAKSIESLDYFEHIRRYPGMYIGSKDENGLLHLVKEILSNSIDEWLNGAGTEINIEIKTDGSIYIKDNGRGIPHGKQEDGMSLLQACFGKANTGGKFNNATGETGYNSSGGEHGTGGKAVNALSTKLIVTTARDGVKEIVEFSRGQFISHKEEKSDEQGVTVQFYPDKEVLEVVDFNAEKIKTMIKEFSFLCKGLRFTLNNKGNKEEFISNNGLYDFLEYLNNGQDYLIPPIYFEETDGTYQVEVAIGYNKSYNNTVKLYTNNIPQEKGTHLTGFKTAFTSVINLFAKQEKLLKENQDSLTGSDVEEGRILIINFRMIDPVFKGQNKEELSSSEGRTYVQRLSTKGLNDYFSTHKKDVKAIVDKALAAKKARDAAKKAREAIRKPKEKGLKAKMQISSKFIDCTNKNPAERSLLLVEGLSAGSAAVEARDAKRDAIYMLRGKVISPLKTEISKILANQEMSDIIRVIGAGFGNDFDVSKMDFDKVVITSDQDADGLDISLLLTTFFFTYMRPLVEAGKLYHAVTPLYIVRTNKEELYMYTEKEMNDFKAKTTAQYDILRAKGCE